jgi:hypothetical protein
MLLRFTLLLTGLLLLQTGCTSMKSTMLNRLSDDSFVVNGKPTNGVPITVRIPTHLDIVVAERLFYYDNDPDENFVDLERVDFKDASRNFKVETTIIQTEKVMTVDFKRPAAGTMEYNLTFDSSDATKQQQYFKQIETMLYDRTLSDTADLVARFVPGALAGTPAAETATFGFSISRGGNTAAGGVVAGGDVATLTVGSKIDNYFVKDRVVAYRRFDLNDCDFEDQVGAFISHHINDCHSCQGRAPLPTSAH